MNIKIISVGKLKEKYLVQGISEYTKRLSKYCKITLVEVPDEKAPDKLQTSGKSQFVFVIGGSLGLSDQVLKRSNAQISFGKMTYPHQLMRLILVEQIYRAFRINAGEPYHK